MFDLSQPSWRHMYALSTPTVEIPGGLLKKPSEAPGGSPSRMTGPGQARTPANDPRPIRDRWDLSRPAKVTSV
jgi:hypothetical protein